MLTHAELRELQTKSLKMQGWIRQQTFSPENEKTLRRFSSWEVAELILGVTRDPAHGFVLTLGLGGILTELIRDTASVLVPASREDVHAALGSLRTAALLTGYRGRPAADLEAVVDTVMALQSLVQTHADALHEIEINPLICRASDAVAADALIRMEE